mmetsp:Transcript_34820/g.100222  ORF Transcript_34820/g.100222 Transcript_34820/m.100222 type:complete len:362 (-) Transcript_34820:2041-3126(-)
MNKSVTLHPSNQPANKPTHQHNLFHLSGLAGCSGRVLLNCLISSCVRRTTPPSPAAAASPAFLSPACCACASAVLSWLSRCGIDQKWDASSRREGAVLAMCSSNSASSRFLLILVLSWSTAASLSLRSNTNWRREISRHIRELSSANRLSRCVFLASRPLTLLRNSWSLMSTTSCRSLTSQPSMCCSRARGSATVDCTRTEKPLVPYSDRTIVSTMYPSWSSVRRRLKADRYAIWSSKSSKRSLSKLRSSKPTWKCTSTAELGWLASTLVFSTTTPLPPGVPLANGSSTHRLTGSSPSSSGSIRRTSAACLAVSSASSRWKLPETKQVMSPLARDSCTLRAISSGLHWRGLDRKEMCWSHE